MSAKHSIDIIVICKFQKIGTHLLAFFHIFLIRIIGRIVGKDQLPADFRVGFAGSRDKLFMVTPFVFVHYIQHHKKGIPTHKPVISVTFVIGSALAAVGSMLNFTTYPAIVPTAGAMPGLKAFVAAVFGGIGSIPGAFLGGILLGIIENLSKAYISTQLSDAIVFLVLVVVLIVKPTGLLGKKVNVKV